jgi:IMP dehydrogenase
MGINANIDAFMTHFPVEGLTYDDVSLVTQYADFLPDETDTTTRLTTRIALKAPFVSAAMDTVTESRMAIAMGLLGGIGIIHKNLTIDEQAAKVAAVKHYLNGLIRDPIIFRETDTIGHVVETKQGRHFSFSGFPILNAEDKLVGILTAADTKFHSNMNTPVRDVMTSNLITADPDTSLEEAHAIMMESKVGKLPLVDAQGKLVGLYSFADVKRLAHGLEPNYNLDDKYRLRVGAAVGPNDHERAAALAKEDVDVLVVDSAHGHSKGILDMVRWIAENLPQVDIIAGNVATGEGAAALVEAGAHAVKVGIGPGSICTTRVVCGVGIPQISAIYAARQAIGDDVPIIADGGIRHSGDVPKALTAGADTVMLGSLLAGTEESPGEKIIHQGRQYVVYRGMGSVAAMKSGKGSRERYSQGDVDAEDLVPQGIEGIVPYAGTVAKVMNQFVGGLRSSLGYNGTRSVAELRQNGRFIRVSMAGLHEAHPHDVKIMKEAPNYRS